VNALDRAGLDRSIGLRGRDRTEQPVRILILEDDPLIALDLAAIVEDAGHEVIGLFDSLAEARRHLEEDIEFALLDVDVSDGKSFEIASALSDRAIPFAFVSGSTHGDLPSHLREASFISKPFQESTIVRSLARCRPVLGHLDA
jgi:DNA-binding NtrC family response regulator